ncbi:RVP_2 domain-containing protein [Cephalotus follicularis]|uniref:RVP_2 domain-containing protein n=1 Tax=Cephalotus follicularis TaxID=3775 RepID=A0A1Q3AQ25_CEPFO|nr:RVP_2 domain-containing protein [Cephalotus follicularis]
MSHAELKARRDKGLCYNCDEKYAPSHKCKGKFMLLLPVKDEEELTEIVTEFEHMTVENSENQDCFEEGIWDNVVTDEFFPEISIHALAGQSKPSTPRLTGRYHSHNLQVLIDNGGIHNFLKETMATRLALPILPCKPFKVFVGNGKYLECSKRCETVNIELQHYPFAIDLFILPIQGADLVFGIQWLKILRPIVTDYHKLTMDFNWKNKPVHLVGEPQLNPQPIQAKQLKKLASFEGIAHLYHLVAVTTKPPENSLFSDITPQVADLLTTFDSISQNQLNYLLKDLLIIKYTIFQMLSQSM